MWSSDIFLTQNDEQISSLEQWGVYLNVKVALFLCHFGIRLLNKLKHVNKTQIKKIDWKINSSNDNAKILLRVDNVLNAMHYVY